MIDALRQIAGELRQPTLHTHALADRLDQLADKAETDRDALAREAARRRIIAAALHDERVEEERHDFRRFG